MKKLFLIPVLTLLFMSVTAIASAQWVTTQLTDNSYNESEHQISDSGHAVWSGYDGSDGEIFYYDGTTITQLTNNSNSDYDPQINDSGQVVWWGYDGSGYEIFYYDGTTITQLTNNSDVDRDPQINDSGHVVWSGYDGTDREIFYYDRTTVTQLTNNSDYDLYPQINGSGHVVWSGFDGLDYEIFYYDGTTVTQLTNNSYDDGKEYGEPQISAGGHVVWQGIGGSDGSTDSEIFYYDGTTVTQLTNNSYSDYSPQINDSGQVVWWSKGGSNSEILYYDGTTVTQLTNNSVFDGYPQINASGQVVWYGYDGTDGSSDYEIFYYDGTTITQLTNNSYIVGSPQINDSGQVVWSGREGGEDQEIFFAELIDIDSDGVFDDVDNCLTTCNPSQLDADGDGTGDSCDATPGCGGCGQPACEVSCDIDNDGILNAEDNCPEVTNPGQENADNDSIGDVCDADTVYGYISGDVLEGNNIDLYGPVCGGTGLVDTVTTNAEGYYAFGSLSGTYSVEPNDTGCSFSPASVDIDVPQAVIQSYNFTATEVLNTIASINDNMVSVPSGTFQMGCTPGDKWCHDNDSPRHSVTLSSFFEIGRYEVTQGQWEAVMESNPSNFDTCGDNCPVEEVTWKDCQTFITTLNTQTGQSYRMCTNAEWEYAARAGTETTWYCGDDDSCLDDIAWYRVNNGNTNHPAGQKTPNAWGLYDMIGNVDELVNDRYGAYTSDSVTDPTGPVSGIKRVVRGRAGVDALNLRGMSFRYDEYEDMFTYSFMGFRLCR